MGRGGDVGFLVEFEVWIYIGIKVTYIWESWRMDLLVVVYTCR